MKDVKYGWNSGEFGPEFWGRSDVERYGLGAAHIENFYVTYSGSLRTREPLRFAEYCQTPEATQRLFSFEFSNSIDAAYCVIFGSGTIRFMRDGAYILEDAVTVSGVASGIATSTAHGYENGDLVYLDTYPNILVISGKTTNGWIARDIDGNAISINSVATLSRRVFTLAHPYSSAALASLRAYQVFDVVKFTHPDYAPMLLTRTATTWTFAAESRTGGKPLLQTATATTSGKFIRYARVTSGGSGYSNATQLSISDATGSGAVLLPTVDSGVIVSVTIDQGGRNYTAPTISANVGTGATFEIGLAPAEAEFVIAVSAVIAGEETGISRPAVITGAINFAQTQGSATYSWAAVAGAESYNVYRSIIFPLAGQANIGAELFYIGSTQSTSFVDNNVQSDATRSPRFFFDPLANGAITYVQVTAGGSGYSHTSTVSASGGGSGFTAYPIVQAGVIVGIYIADPGANYSNPTITVSGGSGATFSPSVTPLTGNNPAISYIFQQRAGYGGTNNSPQQIIASRIREFDNFSTSGITTDADAYDYTIDSQRLSPIRHVLPVQQGLLVFTRDGVSLLRAGENSSVTPTNGVLDPQSFIGAATIPPVLAEEDIIYTQEKSRGLRLLSFNANARKYDGQEISFFSRHLFRDRTITSLTSTAGYDNRLYGSFSDGAAYQATVQREQQTFAFTRMTTQGLIKDCVAVNVGTEEHVYYLVKRMGRLAVEFTRPPETDQIEDNFLLDSALLTPKIHPAASVTVSGLSGVVTVTASANVFAVGDVGKVFAGGGSRGVVTNFLTANSIEVTLTRPISNVNFQTSVAADIPQGDWWLNPYITSVSGIPHEGATIGVIADGKRQNDKVVTNGAITLDFPAALVRVGFAAQAKITTLPPPADGKLINTLRASVYYRNATTINYGTGDAAPYNAPLRTNEPWAEPNYQTPDEQFFYIDGIYALNDKITLTIDDGLPAEILRITVFYNEENDVVDQPSKG